MLSEEKKDTLDFMPHKFVPTEAYSNGPGDNICTPQLLCMSFLIFTCVIISLPAYLALSN